MSAPRAYEVASQYGEVTVGLLTDKAIKDFLIVSENL